MTQKQKYEQWVDKALEFIYEVGPRINCYGSGAMQSAPVLDHHPEVVFLGHDAHEPYGWEEGKEEQIRRRFFEGNPAFYHIDDSDKNRHGWKFWTLPRFIFNIIEKDNRLVKDGNFVLMNAFFFGAHKIDQLCSKMTHEDAKRNVELTRELICDIFKPKAVVCFSVEDVFGVLPGIKDKQVINLGTNRTVMRGTWDNGIAVFGIPHFSSSLSYEDRDKIIAYIDIRIKTLKNGYTE